MQISLKSIFLLILPLTSFAQKTIVPGNPDINTARLKPGKSLFTIYYVKGQTWTKKGTYTNDISISGNELKFTVDYVDDKGELYSPEHSHPHSG